MAPPHTLAFLLLTLFATISLGALAGRPTTLNALSENSISLLNSDLVNVTLYEESYCPYCAKFIVGPLAQLFQNGLSDIINLTIVPYGNAKVIGAKTRCQHGPNECKLDKIEACVIEHYPDMHSWFSFISCAEQQPADARLDLWPQCGVALGLDVIGIQNCADGAEGDKLEARNRELTDALHPAHRYVPWVTINGEPLYEDFGSFFDRICDAYRGAKKPDVCAKVNRETIVYESPASFCSREELV